MTTNRTISRARSLGAAFAWGAARGAARWLCLAASPIFALMALATAMSGAPDMGCSMGQDASPLGGMFPMYLLMSAFHLAPWLREMSGRAAGPESIG